MSNQSTPDYQKLGDLAELIGRRDYVGVPQAALILGIHPQTVHNMIRTKKLAAIRVGSRHKIFLAELDRVKNRGNLHPEDAGADPLSSQLNHEESGL